jgi:hypothetical protein
LRGAKHRDDRFLAVGMVARDVEELAGCAKHAVSELVDKERARHVILERQYGVIVGRTGSSV